jgi:hypothetical protein
MVITNISHREGQSPLPWWVVLYIKCNSFLRHTDCRCHGGFYIEIAVPQHTNCHCCGGPLPYKLPLLWWALAMSGFPEKTALSLPYLIPLSLLPFSSLSPFPTKTACVGESNNDAPMPLRTWLPRVRFHGKHELSRGQI